MTKVHISGECIKKVSAIKAIRRMAGLGLKESKELVDTAIINGSYFNVYEIEHHMDDISELKETGLKVSMEGQWTVYKDQLKEIATVATLAGDYYIAHRILDVLEDL